MQTVKRKLRALIDEITLNPEALTISMRFIFPGPLSKTDPGSGLESKVCCGRNGSGGGRGGGKEHVFW